MKMKSIFTILAAAIFSVGCSSSETAQQPQKPDPYDFVSVIDTTYLIEHLSVIASDEYGGRETGTKGIDMTESYMSDRYSELGLTPIGEDSTYLQTVPLNSVTIEDYSTSLFQVADGDTTMSSMMVTDNSRTAPVTPIYGITADIKAPVVFAGYGLMQGDSVNHFEDIDVAGKWVVAFVHPPDSVEGEAQNSMRGLFMNVIRQQQAAGLLIVTKDDAGYTEAVADFRESFGESQGLELAYLNEGGASWSIGYTSPTFAAELLGLSPEEMKQKQKEIFESPETFSGQETSSILHGSAGVENNIIEGKNIVALFEGTDPMMSEEVIVLTSHHDHIGFGRPDSTGDNLYNGADDDGSGTIGLLAVANALTKAKKAGAEIKRSVLFLHVTAEEKGLLGSRYYSDHPIIPIEQTVANLNVDMIGRVGNNYQGQESTDYVYIIGAEIISSDVDSLLKVGNANTENITLDMRYNDLDDPNQFYRRSDHWNFGRLGVPFAFFFNGVHDDYHRPSDELDKIEWKEFAQRVRVLYGTTVEIANWDSRPQVDNEEFIERTQ